MKTPFSYAFEELTPDLPRPPKAALRSMFTVGVLLSPRGWSTLRIDTRQDIATEGQSEEINSRRISELLREAPPGQIRLVSKMRDPSAEQVPPPLAQALGPTRVITNAQWHSLRAIDRYVLATLAGNTRLLWKALDELAQLPGSQLTAAGQTWSGALAHCEVRMTPEALIKFGSALYLDGRAVVLARVAGIRAARRAPDTFDLRSETTCGPAELDGVINVQKGVLLWQGHASTWDGEFFPAASLLAVSTAAVASYDMAKELDPSATIGAPSIVEEPWQTTTSEGDREEATVLYSVRPSGDLSQRRSDPVSGPPTPPIPSHAVTVRGPFLDGAPKEAPSATKPVEEKKEPVIAPVVARSSEPAQPQPLVAPPAPAWPTQANPDDQGVATIGSSRTLRLTSRNAVLALVVALGAIIALSTLISIVMVRMLGKS